ncbi:MAG: ParB/RepB/Spo0J family partition protein [Verrucomicrobiota bacterium]
MAKKSGLGKGLGALIKEVPVSAPTEPEGEPDGVTRIPVGQIETNPHQPRQFFEPEALEDLVRSIKEHGVLQPLIVRKAGDHYELIAGERRFRASQKAGLTDVPVVQMDVSDQGAMELALIENLQREDLNPIEEAEGYQRLAKKFDLTQEQVAERVGKGRPTIANALRLLSLPAAIQEDVSSGRLSGGHAKVLLGLDSPEEQILLATQCVREGLSVRALEALIGKEKKPAKKPRAEKSDIPAEHIRYLSDKLHDRFATSVHLSPCKTLANGKKAKGKIEIDYYSPDDLDRLLTLLGITEEL